VRGGNEMSGTARHFAGSARMPGRRSTDRRTGEFYWDIRALEASLQGVLDDADSMPTS
jgi:hypothetical protein